MKNDVNGAYAAYVACPSSMTQAQLIKQMEAYADKIVWLLLKTRCPEIVNAAIDKTLRSPFSGDAKFSTFFYSVVRNASWDYLKQNRRQNERFAPLEESEELAFCSDAETRILLSQLKKLLPEADQPIFEMRLQGFTGDEIAAKLNISPTTADRRWRGIVKRLREVAATN